MDVLKELITMIITTIIGVLVIIVIGVTGVIVPSYLINKAICSAKAETQGYDYDYEYGLFKGCMVKTENGWMDYDRLIYKKETE